MRSLLSRANRGIGRALVDEALRRGAKRAYPGTRSGSQIAAARVTLLALNVTNAEQNPRMPRRDD